MTSSSAFDAALRGSPAVLLRSDGTASPLPVRRWRAPAAGEDHWLVGRCRGPTLDLGCGPGRLLEALERRSVPALGVDLSDTAVRLSLLRGARALHRDLFQPLPGEGCWHHVLLADGNLGIGGDPVRLLRRVARLLRPRGTALVEVERRDTGLWRGSARVHTRHAAGPRMPWAAAGIEVAPDLTRGTGLAPSAAFVGERSFVEFTRT